MSEWRTLRIEELAEIVTGSTPRASDPGAWGDHVDFVTPSDQVHGQREAVPSRRLSARGADELAKRIVPPGSTALTCIGSTIGKVSMNRRHSVTNQQINSLVAKVGTDPTYLYYLIASWSSILRAEASGSATPIINKSTLAKYELTVPDFDCQRAIGAVLGALDDKIEANRKLAATADELSRWKFKGLQARPGSEPVALSSTARFVNGRAFTKGASGTGRVVIRIAELNSGLGGSTVRNDIDVADDHVAHPGDLLFAWSGSLTLARWYRDEAIVNQHIFKVIPNDHYPLWLARQLVQDKLVEFQAIAADKATTMGHIQRRHLDEPVLVPPVGAIRAADEAMEALWRRALLAEMESEGLTHLRDTLLPKLMSGQLRVHEAEELVADAV